MDDVIFFQNKNIHINKLFPKIKFKKKILIRGVKPLNEATKHDLTFLDSSKYLSNASKTKALFCITTENSNKLPERIEKIIVNNVLLKLAEVINKFIQKPILIIQTCH